MKLTQDKLVVGNYYEDKDLGTIKYLGKNANRYNMFKVNGSIYPLWFTKKQIEELLAIPDYYNLWHKHSIVIAKKLRIDYLNTNWNDIPLKVRTRIVALIDKNNELQK